MSFPNITEKYNQPAIIEPIKVVEERGKLGMNPSGPVPVGAIICYDTVLWQWVCTLTNRIECDGWLKGSFLLQRDDIFILVMKAVGVGSPTAVMTLEELTAYGIRKFISLGAAGGLQKDLQVGEIIICDRAIRDEGTSHHYVKATKFASANDDLTSQLVEAVKKYGVSVRIGTSWTTDAPYRETIEELRRYRAEGVLTVEMEAAALFAVGAYRGVKVSSVFAISDVLSEGGWHQGYYSEEKTEGLQKIFYAALDTFVSGDHNQAPTSI